MNGPAQVTAAVVASEPAAAYRRVVLAAPAIAEIAEPGQFVALAVGDAPTATLLRRCFSIHSADAVAGTIEVVVAAHGPGSTWVTTRRPGDVVDVVGPLGHPFPAPAPGARVVLVGGGYGSAPMTWFAQRLRQMQRLRENETGIDLVLGAGDAARLFGAAEGVAAGAVVHVTTDDGSAGTRGRVTDVLPGLLGPDVEVYACGPMAMLRAVHEVASAHGSRSWVAVEESMACGIGVCMTCVLPIRHADGSTRMTRSCVDGPTFDGDDVRWDAVLAGPGGTGSLVPADAVGAPRPGGH